MRRTLEHGLLALALILGGCGSNAELDDGSCDREGATSPCSTTVAYEPGADNATCASGTRTCVGGTWSQCDGHALSIESVGTSVAALTTGTCLNNPCDPSCKVTTETALDVDAGVLLSKTETGGLTLTPNVSDAGADSDAKVCTGYQCQIDACGGDPKKTVVTGTVYDPAGKNPVYNAIVYVPNAAVDAIKEGVSCDSCAASSGSPIVTALTGPDGKFELKGVPSGKGIPLIIQVGKWRRQISIDVTKCVSNSIENPSLVRLPKNRTEGSMPRIAFVSGSADPFQCLFSKMGIDPSEVSVPVDSKSVQTPQRVHYYNSYSSRGDDLSKTYGGAAPSAKTLFGDATRLKSYDVVILSCEGGEYAKDATYQKNMVDYANVGGRVFATHFSYVWLQNADAASNWPSVVQTWNHSSSYSDPLTSYIDTSFPKGAAFSQWLVNVGASTTAGQLVLNEPRRDYTAVDSTKATRWMRAWHDNSIGAPTTTGNACFAASDCGTGTSCSGTGAVCSTGASCSASVACDATLNQVCSSASDCAGTHKSCSSATGTAYCKYKSGTTYYTNKCASGYCANGKACSTDTDCVANQTRSCTADSDCKGGYKCTPYATSKTNVCWYKSGSTLYSGACDGLTCNQSSCTTDSDCGSGNECSGGKCIEAHNMEPMFTFNTPVGTSADKQCGRVVFSDFHVSADAVNVTNGTSTYPENCKTGDLSAQEKALEFMLFDLSSCISPDYEAPTAPPPAPPYLAPVTIVRDFTATCGKAERAVWRFFDWQSVTPSDSNIAITTQTGSTTTVASMTPRSVANIAGAPVTSWTGVDIANVLATSPAVLPGNVLRMTIKLTPSTDGKYAPTLSAWRQSFDCVAAE